MIKKFIFSNLKNYQVIELAQFICSLNYYNFPIFLEGNLGAGKTFLVSKIAKIIGEKAKIKSPSFNKMLLYQKMVHLDCYNFLPAENLDSYQDFFTNKLVLIEWFSRLKNSNFTKYIQVNITYNKKNFNSRNYEIIFYI